MLTILIYLHFQSVTWNQEKNYLLLFVCTLIWITIISQEKWCRMLIAIFENKCYWLIRCIIDKIHMYRLYTLSLSFFLMLMIYYWYWLWDIHIHIFYAYLCTLHASKRRLFFALSRHLQEKENVSIIWF